MKWTQENASSSNFPLTWLPVRSALRPCPLPSARFIRPCTAVWHAEMHTVHSSWPSLGVAHSQSAVRSIFPCLFPSFHLPSTQKATGLRWGGHLPAQSLVHSLTELFPSDQEEISVAVLWCPLHLFSCATTIMSQLVSSQQTSIPSD